MTDPLPRLVAALSDRYTIERKLGEGGMATVYLAEDLKHKRKVALKVLKPDLAAALGTERFLREIETTAGLHHPNILALYDSGEAGQRGSGAGSFLYYVMPVVEGESLRDRLDREKRLPVDDALRITREVGDALRYAHARGIIHRDIKPENILLEGSRAMVADFGIAKAVTSAGGDKLTQTGLAVGTPTYMSPEQSTGETDIDGRSDLYALGSVLYEMLAGEPPYTGASARAIIAKRLMEPVPRISVVRETVPPQVEHALIRVLAKEPADRYATAEDFLAALEEGADTGTVVIRSPAPPRRWSTRAVLTTVLVIAAVALSTWFIRSRSAAPPASSSRDLLAVVPFSVRGSADVDYLGDGIVDLLSAKLDGAGPLQVVNPRAVIALVNSDGIDVADPAAGNTVARKFGAGRYVTGDVVEAGGQLQFTAYLRESPGGGTPIATASAIGAVDAIFALVDSLAFRLVAGTLDDSTANRLQRLAAVTTDKLPALKEYLLGERLVREGGRYREAADAYGRAIAIDTAFALAYYRKSLVGDWVDAYDVRSSADKAMEYADRLSPRDRSLLAALQVRRHGHSDAAEQAYRTHLVAWPDEVEARIQLGEILFHDGPRRGLSMNEAIPVYEAALRLEPGNVDARVHLSRLYALNGRMDELAEDVRQFEKFAASGDTSSLEVRGGERLFEVQSLAAYAANDTAAIADINRRLLGQPWYYWFYAAHGASRFARNPAGAQELLRHRQSDEPLLLAIVANLFVVRGQTDSLRYFLDHIPGGRNVLWDVFESFLWTSGAVEPDSARMEILVTRLRNADPAEMRRANWVPAYEDLTDDFHRFERDYQVALMLIQLDRVDEARPLIAALRSMKTMDQLGNLQADALRSLDAEIQLQAGDQRGALATLRTITYETPHASTYHAFADGSRSRFLRAELELQQGDTAAAVGFYRGFDESWSPWDTYHRPMVYQRLGEIAEAQGRKADAIQYYTWFIDRYTDADPPLQVHRQEILQRRNALLGPR